MSLQLLMFGNWLFRMISIFSFNLLTYNWWIHLQLTLIALAFARWNFLSFLSLKTKNFSWKCESYTRMLQMHPHKVKLFFDKSCPFIVF